MDRDELHVALNDYARGTRVVFSEGAQRDSAAVHIRYCDIFKMDGCLQFFLVDPLGVESKPNPRADQTVGPTLERLCKGLNKKQQQAQWTGVLLASDSEGSTEVLQEATNDEAWMDSCKLVLCNGSGQDFHYVVRRDRPRISKIPRLGGLLLVGFPASCSGAETDFADRVEWQWFRGEKVVCDQEVYVPSSEDLGEHLEILCTPCKGPFCRGESLRLRTERPVHSVASSSLLPLQERLACTQNFAAPAALRVVSYNILWGRPDSEIRKEREKKSKSKQNLATKQEDLHQSATDPLVPISHVSQLPVAIVAREYREHIALHEICGYHADVVCLQEVTNAVLSSWLPVLAERDLLCARSGESGELATLWRSTRWLKVAETTWLISKLLDREQNADLRSAMDAVPEMRAFVMEKPHIGHALLLRDAQSAKALVVVNLHLIMNMYGPAMRALQACLLLREVEHWRHEWGVADAEVVVCGDFNCRGWQPECECIFELLATGAVPREHHNFLMGRGLGRPPCGPEEQCSLVVGNRPRCTGAAAEPGGWCLDHICPCCLEMKIPRFPTCDLCKKKGTAIPPRSLEGYFNCRLTHPLGPMTSAYQAATGTCALFWVPFKPTTGEDWPPDGWGEMKDHIFHSEGLKTRWVLPPPGAASLRGIPSLCWPSDHIALVADLELI